MRLCAVPPAIAMALNRLYAPLKAYRAGGVFGVMGAMTTTERPKKPKLDLSEKYNPVEKKPRLDLSEKYNPGNIETGWYDYWVSRGLFSPTISINPKSSPDPSLLPKERINMLLPPPNVTGQLHIGHALMLSIQDSLARYYRMQGHPVRWLPGTDHAGIATQAVVERHLNLKSRDAIGREKLVAEIEKWRSVYGGRILRQMERMGSSADPALEYYTLSEELSGNVQRAFVRLWEQGLIYRSTKMVNWSVKAGTAISEIEVVVSEVGPEGHKEGAKFGELHKVAYQVVGEEGREVIISTTRPETIFGDRAIGVHPDDPRYKDLHYKCVQHPLLPEVQLPIIPDAELVNPEFGTGAVKITPAHDPNDFEFWKRHSSLASNIDKPSSHSALDQKLPIPIIRVFGIDGKMLPGTHASVVGMDRLKARKQVVNLLKGASRYRGSNPHMMRIAQCSRTGGVIEPMLCPQWFLKMKPLADKVLAKGMIPPPKGYLEPEKFVKEGEKVQEENVQNDNAQEDKDRDDDEATISVSNWASSGQGGQEKKLLIRPFWHRSEWLNWLMSIRDWCLSRQIWWGHRIPAWRVVNPNAPVKKCNENEIQVDHESERWIVALTEADARAQLTPEEQHLQLIQDEDVLDTWFSSGLLPLTTAGWTGSPDQPPEEWRQNYPLTFIESGSDILFFWLARMTMLCTWFSDILPFHEIILHPLVCDATGRKMSKSIGNVLDPLAIIEGRTPQQLIQEVEEESRVHLAKAASLQGTERPDRTTVNQLKQAKNTVQKNFKASVKQFPNGVVESGADALRMALVDYMRQTRLISFEASTVDQFRKLGVKLFNLCKYFETLQEAHRKQHGHEIFIPANVPEGTKGQLQLHDLWMLYHLRKTIQICNEAFITRRLFLATEALKKFIYDVLANIYVMFIKPDLDTGDPEKSIVPQRMTAFAIDVALRLVHPFMPYVTEALWQTLSRRYRQEIDSQSILREPYPMLEDVLEINEVEIAPFKRVLEITEALWAARQHGLEPKHVTKEDGWVRVMLRGADKDMVRACGRYEAQIAKLARLSGRLRVLVAEVESEEEHGVGMGVGGRVQGEFSEEVEKLFERLEQGKVMGKKLPPEGLRGVVVRDEEGEKKGWWVVVDLKMP